MNWEGLNVTPVVSCQKFLTISNNEEASKKSKLMDILQKHLLYSSKISMSWNRKKAFKTSRLNQTGKKW